MRAVRAVAAVLSSVLVAGGAALAVPLPAAAADSVSAVPVTCKDIPIIGDVKATANVSAIDDVDPVAPGGTVVNTINVPVPIQDIPVEASIKEVKLTIPIPGGVTITGVTFSTSSFTTQTWAVNGSNLVATLTGSVNIGGSNPVPTVPDVSVTTTVAGPPRTIQWKVPTSITAKATYFLGQINATCTPDDLDQVLITTTVADPPPPNTAPTATDRTLGTHHGTPLPVTLAGTDPESDPLTFGTTSSPAHGTLTGTAPDLTYTPAAGYVGPDSFTFSASDGLLSDAGTVAIAVTNTVPSPVGAAIGVANATPTPILLGAADADGDALTWTVTSPPAHGTLSGTAPNLTYTSAAGYSGTDQFTFQVFDGAQSAQADVVLTVAPWWKPWSSGTAAVTDLYTWFTGSAPTSSQRTAALASLDGGTQTVGGLVASLRRGADATANVDPTTRLYAAYFVRIPDAGGLNSWIGKRRKGRTLNSISASFAASSEFTTRYGQLSNQAFVELVYQNVLGRAGDAAGIASWTKKLDKRTKTRGQVMVGFSESNEYKVGQVDRVDAAVVFIHLLGRAPNLAERDAFATAAHGDLAGTVQALLGNAALAARAH